MSSNKREKYFTLLVLSNADTKIRKFKVHFNWLRAAFIVAGVIIVTIVTLVSNVYIVRNELDDRVVELDRLKEKISYKEIEIANLQEQSNEIKFFKNIDDFSVL